MTNSQDAIPREAVASSKEEDLQAAIDELESHGFDRAEVSLLASEHAVEQKLGHKYERSRSSRMTRRCLALHIVSTESIGDAEGSLIGAPLYIAATAALGAILVSGGTVAAAIVVLLLLAVQEPLSGRSLRNCSATCMRTTSRSSSNTVDSCYGFEHGMPRTRARRSRSWGSIPEGRPCAQLRGLGAGPQRSILLAGLPSRLVRRRNAVPDLAFTLLGSIGAILGAALFLVLPRWDAPVPTPFLVSFAVGTLLGSAFLCLIPSGLEKAPPLPFMATIWAALSPSSHWRS